MFNYDNYHTTLSRVPLLKALKLGLSALCCCNQSESPDEVDCSCLFLKQTTEF